jgi:diphosphomevalonate decarboxylase
MKKRDWNTMSEVIMRDSNNFHSICLDTYPPIFYLDDFSREVMELVHQFNSLSEIHIAYTFDAGPHAFLIIPKSVEKDVFSLVL